MVKPKQEKWWERLLAQIARYFVRRKTKGSNKFTVSRPINRTGYRKYRKGRGDMHPKWIVIHHSATPDGQTYDFESMKKYHMSYRHEGKTISHQEANKLVASGQKVTRPWRTIGYHLVVEEVKGNVEVIQGRNFNEEGAHALGFNDKSIGICIVGNYDKEPPTETKIFKGASLCRNLMREFNIPVDQVIGHRETFAKLNKSVQKTCPGSAFDMDLFRNRLKLT